MMTASVRFLTNSLLADMTCRESEFREHLQSIGILTVPMFITLDNARTLQIQLRPDDETGETLYSIVNVKKDTLGMVQRLCRYVYCMNDCDKEAFLDLIESGKIRTVDKALQMAKGLREQHSLAMCR